MYGNLYPSLPSTESFGFCLALIGIFTCNPNPHLYCACMGIVMSIHKSTNQLLVQSVDAAKVHHACYCPANEREYRALERCVRSGLLVRAFRGMYARKASWEALSVLEQARYVIRTLSDAHSSWIFSHTSAAIMHNLEVPYYVCRPFHYYGGPKTSGRGTAHITCHRGEALGQQKNGALVTPIEQTVVDCAAYYPFRYALPIADSALHLGLTSTERLQSYLESRANKRGLRQARHVISLADARPDNGGESFVRAIMIENKLPLPDLQVPIEDPENPGHYFYADYLFERGDGTKIDMELDGKEKYLNGSMTNGRAAFDVMMAERHRESRITRYGIQVVRFDFKTARNPRALLQRLALYGVEPMK